MGAQIEVLPAVPRLGALFAKALLPRLGEGAVRVPERTAMVLGLTQDRDRLADYARVCGFPLRDVVPPTWLHVLTFGLHIHLLSGPDCSIRPAGIVHVSNRMTLHRRVDAAEVLDVAARVDNLRPHRRGALFDVTGHVRIGGSCVWEGVSTYLAPGARVPGTPGPERAEFEPRPANALWRLPASLGTDYRRVSGDPNPIHTHRLAARAFGFARPIVHGMWTHARLLAALTPRLPQRYSVAVEFTRPILLPATVAAWWRPTDDGWSAAVTTADGAKPYLLARLS